MKDDVIIKNNKLSFKFLNCRVAYNRRLSGIMKRRDFVVFLETDYNHFSHIEPSMRTYSIRDGIISMSIDVSNYTKIMSVIVCSWSKWATKLDAPTRVLFAKSFDSDISKHYDNFKMSTADFRELTGLVIGSDYVNVTGTREHF